MSLSAITECAAACAKAGIPFTENELLARHTSFGIGGPALIFARPRTADELSTIVRVCAVYAVPWMVIGGGTNLLVSDEGYPGVMICLDRDFRAITFEEEGVRCGAAAPLALVVARAAERGLAGIEALGGIPGTVGGAVAGNAGTHDGWIGTCVQWVRVCTPTGEIATRARTEITFSYRSAALDGSVVMESLLSLKPGVKNDIVKTHAESAQYRRKYQPIGARSAGCIFKNPPGDSAGRLIDAAGLKGLTVGKASVSVAHANFIVAEAGASATDVTDLILRVRDAVYQRFSVLLTLEVKAITISALQVPQL